LAFEAGRQSMERRRAVSVMAQSLARIAWARKSNILQPRPCVDAFAVPNVVQAERKI
jgi:hypothetical protein